MSGPRGVGGKLSDLRCSASRVAGGYVPKVFQKVPVPNNLKPYRP